MILKVRQQSISAMPDQAGYTHVRSGWIFPHSVRRWRNSNLRFRINLAPSLSPISIPFHSSPRSLHFASFSDRPFFIIVFLVRPSQPHSCLTVATFVIALFTARYAQWPYQTRGMRKRGRARGRAPLPSIAFYVTSPLSIC